MRWLSGDTHRFRPVFFCLLFLTLCFIVCPADASSYCGLTENACPVCGDLALNDSSAYDSNLPDDIFTPVGFAQLTCNYGDPLSGNTAKMTIVCYQNASIAKTWYQYYRREIPYPFPETGYGSANSYSEHTRGHRVMPVAIFGEYGGIKKNPATFKEAYADWDYAVSGRYEAEIESLTPTDTITQEEATAANVKRIQQYAGCFASFNPGGARAPQKSVMKGTVTGTGFTRQLYQDMQEAIDDAVFHENTEKVIALVDRIEAGSAMKKPLRHAKIIWKGGTYSGAPDEEYITSTDENGNFEIPAELTPGKQYQFDIGFTYRKAETDYFSISQPGIYNDAIYSHVFEYNGPQDLRQDVDILAAIEKADVDKEYLAGMRSTLLLYDETANALEFYQDHLGEKLDCNLPLGVYPFWPDRRSKFEIDSGRGNGTPSPAIILKPDDTTFDNPIHSQYVVYHEFSHYAMYCTYGKKFPESPADKTGAVKTVNHGGYMNPSTSDSYTEGFAHFMAAAIQEYYGNPMAGTSGGMGGIEDIVRAYEYEGKAEEFAVSATLWNLYNTDSHYADRRKTEEKIRRDILANPGQVAFDADLAHMTPGDYRAQVTREIDLLQAGNNLFEEEHPVKLRFDQIWPVLRTYNRDFTDVYTGFVTRYPDRKGGIDSVFAAHGFYRDTVRGNGSYDPGEPWRVLSGDRTSYAANDPFIDYPTGGFPGFPISRSYTGSETVGSASEYQRTSRRSTVTLPGHFIRTTVDVPLYVVSVEYYDRPWKSYRAIVSGENNMVPVPVPPPGENAGITVMPVGVRSDAPLFFRSEEFNRDFPAAAARGYYLEHDFRVSGPIPARTAVKAGGTSRPRDIISILLKSRGPLADGLPAGPASGIPLYLSIPAALVGIAVLAWRLQKE